MTCILFYFFINYCNVNFRTLIVHDYFSLKDMTPLTHSTNVVKYFNRFCDKTQSYMGNVKRYVALRAEEHPSGNMLSMSI